MSKLDGTTKLYQIFSQSWYADANRATMNAMGVVDEITLSWEKPPFDGTVVAEMAIRWHGISAPPTPCLEVFEDAWRALPDCKDLLEGLARLNGTSPEPCVIAALLDECGFRDYTQRISPHAAPDAANTTLASPTL